MFKIVLSSLQIGLKTPSFYIEPCFIGLLNIFDWTIRSGCQFFKNCKKSLVDHMGESTLLIKL